MSTKYSLHIHYFFVSELNFYYSCWLLQLLFAFAPHCYLYIFHLMCLLLNLKACGSFRETATLRERYPPANKPLLSTTCSLPIGTSCFLPSVTYCSAQAGKWRRIKIPTLNSQYVDGCYLVPVQVSFSVLVYVCVYQYTLDEHDVQKTISRFCNLFLGSFISLNWHTPLSWTPQPQTVTASVRPKNM